MVVRGLVTAPGRISSACMAFLWERDISHLIVRSP
jgi:hypothetical protein